MLEIEKNDVDLIIEDEEIIFNPYNPLNNEITVNDVQTILKNYGVNYNIDNIILYQRAFVHRSYTKHPILENYKKTEQWIESVVRIYLHDKSILQKKTTLVWLQKNRGIVWKNAEAIFSFEGIIHNKLSTNHKKEEQQLLSAWNLFYEHLDKELQSE